MFTIFFLFSFALGAIIGSFLNVVAYRYGTAKNLGGRSSCMTCCQQLKWYELIPVVSYVMLSGKCRTCKSKISSQYPFVESITGLLFALTFLKLLPVLETSPLVFVLLFAFFAYIFSILMVIAVYDIRHKMIPDRLVFLFSSLSLAMLVFMFFISGDNLISLVINLLSGPVLALPFALLWYFSKGKWIGFGDAKIALGMGWFLGLAGGVSAVALGFWIGAVVSIFLLLVSKYGKSKIKITRNTEIPFAPFLLIGLAVVFFFNFDFFYINQLMSYAL
jgi:prepilin signal peptidase PulO-like enzyme (type II secretory pathway)